MDICIAQTIVLAADGEMCPECGHTQGVHSDMVGCLVERWREYCACVDAFIDKEWVRATGQRGED